jgi:hypothetical protein
MGWRRGRLVNLAGLVLAEGEEVALNQSAVLRGYSVRALAQHGARVEKCVQGSLAANSLFRKKYSLFERVGNFTLSQRNHCVNLATQAANRDRIGKIPC